MGRGREEAEGPPPCAGYNIVSLEMFLFFLILVLKIYYSFTLLRECFYFMCITVYVSAYSSWRLESSGPLEVELHVGCWDLNPGLLQEQLTTKPFSQPCFCFVLLWCVCVTVHSWKARNKKHCRVCSLSTFMWVPGLKLKSSRSHGTCLTPEPFSRAWLSPSFCHRVSLGSD